MEAGRAREEALAYVVGGRWSAVVTGSGGLKAAARATLPTLLYLRCGAAELEPCSAGGCCITGGRGSYPSKAAAKAKLPTLLYFRCSGGALNPGGAWFSLPRASFNSSADYLSENHSIPIGHSASEHSGRKIGAVESSCVLRIGIGHTHTHARSRALRPPFGSRRSAPHARCVGRLSEVEKL